MTFMINNYKKSERVCLLRRDDGKKENINRKKLGMCRKSDIQLRKPKQARIVQNVIPGKDFVN